MSGRVLDCCALLNLYSGWGGLTELERLPGTWWLCSAVLSEAIYTRDYGTDGLVAVASIARENLLGEKILEMAPESPYEMELYVDFATELDDGEAQALAIAKARNLELVTDDKKATLVAASPTVGVRTVTTANVLREWADLPGTRSRVRDVLLRIQTLARFTPQRSTPGADWWLATVEKSLN
ncbi:hypothetical protein ACFWZ3_09640 [Frateuria sp. GZRR35]|uniref:hypothetical protein n=1 Tax=Frateuria sp. GZRR35 TaxID=3351536 RepID=UPI003EDBEB2A